MIVAMAVLTTLAMPPSLRWALQRLPIREEEQKRLDRESFEKSGFVPKLERVLVAADDSPNGVFAARLAGLIAGSRGMAVSIFKIPGKRSDDAAADDTADPVVATLEQSAEAAADDETPAAEVDVVQAKEDQSLAAAIANEARKGFDFLVIGVDPASSSKGGGFDSRVSQIACAFSGPVAVVAARGPHEPDPQNAPLNLLVPVTGNEVSRRGAEVAVTLGKTGGAPLMVLSVLPPGARNERDRLSTARRDAAETVKEIKAIADFNEVEMKSSIRTDISAVEAILRQARRGRHNLIVLGVSRRPGKTLSFGDLATALLESSDRSVMFVAPLPTASARHAAAESRAATEATQAT